MPVDQSIPKIEVAAARLAIELKHLFATELKLAAIALANGAEHLTSDHYRQAVPAAVAKVLQVAKSNPPPSTHAERRVA